MDKEATRKEESERAQNKKERKERKKERKKGNMTHLLNIKYQHKYRTDSK